MSRSRNGHVDRASTKDPVQPSSGENRELLLAVERMPREPMREALRRTLAADISDGRLPAGTMLPSSRSLASTMGVSRGVVTAAYEQLAAAGFLSVADRRAPKVATVTRRRPTVVRPVEAVKPEFDLVATSPDTSLFPRSVWARSTAAACRSATVGDLDYSDVRGQIQLRRSLSRYLARARVVEAPTESMMITQGTVQAIFLLASALRLLGHTRIAFEHPSIPEHRQTAAFAGLDVVPCRIDDEGLDIAALHDSGARAVVVTPAHQFPAGVVMSASRRRQLIAWACDVDGIVIEDDYDAEFRYDREPVASLQGLNPDHVVHVGTAAKSLSPSLRLGWLTAPERLVAPLVVAKEAVDQGSPSLPQLAFADMIENGHFERHLFRVRRTYRLRRDALVTALLDAMPEARITGISAGAHFVFTPPRSLASGDVVGAAAREGLRLRSIEHYVDHSSAVPSSRAGAELVVGFGKLPEHAVGRAVAALERALAPPGQRRR